MHCNRGRISGAARDASLIPCRWGFSPAAQLPPIAVRAWSYKPGSLLPVHCTACQLLNSLRFLMADPNPESSRPQTGIVPEVDLSPTLVYYAV